MHILYLYNIKNSAATKDNFITNYMKWIGHTEFGPNYKPISIKTLSLAMIWKLIIGSNNGS